MTRRLSFPVVRDLRQVFAHAPIRRAGLIYGVVAVALGAAAVVVASVWTVLAVLVCALALFPVVEYVVHRWVLHPLIYLDSRLAARFWIRAHFAHHTDPSQEDVILADPLAAAALVLVLMGLTSWAAPATALPWAFAAVTMFLFYEVVHFAIHMPSDYETAYLRDRRSKHALHHFHNEHVNYGICFSLVDWLAGTHAAQPRGVDRSGSVRNLGYGPDVAARKPLVRIEYDRRQARR